jgi:hypothetical protein
LDEEERDEILVLVLVSTSFRLCDDLLFVELDFGRGDED